MVNVGSSSLKLRVLADDDGVVASKDLPTVDLADVGDEIMAFLEPIPAVDAAGHRVVHGGSVFTGPVVLDDAVDQIARGSGGTGPSPQPP